MEDVHYRFVIDYGFGSTKVRYGARCRICDKLQLVPSYAAESWCPDDAIGEKEAIKLLKEHIESIEKA